MTILNMVYYKVDSGWQPGANTIAYYPLTSVSTVYDESGNNRNLTNTGISFGLFNGVNCAYNASTSYHLRANLGVAISSTSFTINEWIYKTGGNSETYFTTLGTNRRNQAIIGQLKTGTLNFAFWYDDLSSTTSLSNNTWYNVCFSYNTSTKEQKMYVNGQLNNSRTATVGTSVPNNYVTLFSDNWSFTETFYGGISNVILESKEWADTEISNYYNQTKSNYGL